MYEIWLKVDEENTWRRIGGFEIEAEFLSAAAFEVKSRGLDALRFSKRISLTFDVVCKPCSS